MTPDPSKQGDWLPKDAAAEQESEILERIVDEFTKRIRAGEHPAISEYQNQHPNLKDEIEDLLASVAMIEQLKSNPSQPVPSNRPSLDKVSKLRQIGNYDVVREIGRGGMGVVFEAVHESLGRRVAIKVMPTPLMNGEKYVERFKQESQAAAKLHHTNIVAVFGVGQGDGYHYYVMDLVDGQTLSDVVFGLANSPSNESTKRIDRKHFPTIIQGTPGTTQADISGLELNKQVSEGETLNLDSNESSASLSLDEIPIGITNPKHFRWVARLGSNLADALSYAHESKILHRDIKPANIILDRKGGIWITDFGLAKDSSRELNLTQTGDVIGTPQYLAPESLEGKYDQRSEVYCLGLTLYELATLKQAYPSGTTAEVIRAIATMTPTPPRKVNPKIPIDLSTIIEKSLARDPGSRYQTAKALRDDLTAFVNDQPISARPPSTFEKITKWGKRNPLAASLAAVSTLLLALVAISASVGYIWTVDALRKEAEKTATLKRSEKRMQAQYERAEANIKISIQAFDEMFKQVVSRGTATSSSTNLNIDGFEELMGMESSVTKEDADFLIKLVEFYDQFAKQNSDNKSLQIESARAFRRVANIYQRVGEFKKSNEAYRDAVKLYNKSYVDSQSKDTLISLVQAKNELAQGLLRDQTPGLAKKEHAEALALLGRLPVNQLDDELKLEMAKTYSALGTSSTWLTAMLSSANANPRPRMFPGRGRFLFDQLRGEDGEDGSAVRGGRGGRGGGMPMMPFGPGRMRFGEGGRGGDGGRGGEGGRGGDGWSPRERREEMGPRAGAEHARRMGREMNRQLGKALDILDDLIEKSPSNLSYRFERAKTYSSLSASLLRIDPERSYELRNSAIKEFEILAEQAPDRADYRYRLALACWLGGAVNSPTPAMETERIELLERSVEIAFELTKQNPNVPDYHFLHGSVRKKSAEIQIAAKEYQAALESIQFAHAALKQLIGFSPMGKKYRNIREGVRFEANRLLKSCQADEGLSEKEKEKIANSAKAILDLLPPVLGNAPNLERRRPE